MYMHHGLDDLVKDIEWNHKSEFVIANPDFPHCAVVDQTRFLPQFVSLSAPNLLKAC